MASTRRRGPRTAMPTTRPCASTRAPPSVAGLSTISTRMRLSIVPPRRLCQGPPTVATMPRLATGPPRDFPLPGRCTRAQRCRIGGRRRWHSIRLKAQRSDVHGGVPTRERSLDQASTGSVILMSSSCSNTSSAVTIIPNANGCRSKIFGHHREQRRCCCRCARPVCGMIRKRDKWIGGFGHVQVLQNNGA